MGLRVGAVNVALQLNALIKDTQKKVMFEFINGIKKNKNYT